MYKHHLTGFVVFKAYPIVYARSFTSMYIFIFVGYVRLLICIGEEGLRLGRRIGRGQ